MENFFNPKSVAIIGATNDKNKVGFSIMTNLLKNTERKFYPISISEKEVFGIKTFENIKNIPNKIDLAVIAIRADIVPQIIEECGEKDIKQIIVISAGFKEIGEQGKILEEKIKSVAKKYVISLLGPNCLGIIDTHSDFNASFAVEKPPKGGISFLSQSGALGTSLIDLAISENVGFSKFISLGNEADLTEMEFLEFLGKDENTSEIMIYLEKLSKGQEFIKLAKEISKTKPVVVLKAGRSTRGMEAVMSHTGSLAPEDSVFSAACKEAGIIETESIREFFNVAKLFQLGIKKPLTKFAIITNGGGPSVVTADLVDMSKSLSLISIKEETKESLKKVLPPMAALGNPIDIIGDALAKRYDDALQILCKEKEINAIILILTPQMMTEVKETAELVVKYRKEIPIIPVFLGGPFIEKGLKILKENGLVNFNFPKDAVEALSALATGKEKQSEGSQTSAKDTVLSKMMSFANMSKLLNDYEISLNGVFVKEREEIKEAVQKLENGPFAMKAISSDIVHKTDSGAVRLNLKDENEIEKAWDEICAKNPDAKIEGMILQPMISGKEIIIGMKRDAVFGPTILFGLGGIFAEILKDTSIRIAPVDYENAKKMITEIKAKKILLGSRGEKSVDIDALAKLIEKISRLAVEHPEIKEIDFNPVIITSENISVVDVRIMI